MHEVHLTPNFIDTRYKKTTSVDAHGSSSGRYTSFWKIPTDDQNQRDQMSRARLWSDRKKRSQCVTFSEQKQHTFPVIWRGQIWYCSQKRIIIKKERKESKGTEKEQSSIWHQMKMESTKEDSGVRAKRSYLTRRTDEESGREQFIERPVPSGWRPMNHDQTDHDYEQTNYAIRTLETTKMDFDTCFRCDEITDFFKPSVGDICSTLMLKSIMLLLRTIVDMTGWMGC